MKIGDIVYDLLMEEVINKSLYDNVRKKWLLECPELNQLDGEEIDKKLEPIFNAHSRVKGSLRVDMPAVVSFLTRYSGINGREKFTFDIIKDIKRIPLKKLVEFLEEHTNLDVDLPCIEKNKKDEAKEEKLRLKQIFDKDGQNKTLQKINESKRMWDSDENCVINLGPLRVYEILNQNQAVRMGYYYHEIYKKNKILGAPDGDMNSPWCITARGSGTKEYESYDENGPVGNVVFSFAYGSLYSNYRNQGSTFYFIIDETKQDTNKFHMSALQIKRDGKFSITNLYNSPHEKPISWDEIVDIYPNLRDHKQDIQWRAFDEDEVESKSIVDMVNEIPGNRWEFAALTLAEKTAYIDASGSLTQKKSWESMNEELRKKYITTMDNGTIFIKISTFDFLTVMLKTSKSSLEYRLKQLGKKVSDLILHFISGEFKEIRSNIANENIKLLQNRRTKKIGIFDLNKNDWLVKNGVTYNPEYKSLEVIYLRDSTNREYTVDIYTKSPTPDQTSFYSLYIHTDFKDRVAFPSYFISKSKWEELIQNGTLVSDDDEQEFEYGNNDISADVDIKEMLK